MVKTLSLHGRSAGSIPASDFDKVRVEKWLTPLCATQLFVGSIPTADFAQYIITAHFCKLVFILLLKDSRACLA